MRTSRKRLIQSVARRLGVGITSYRHLQELREGRGGDIDFLCSLDNERIVPALRAMEHSKSQIRQDLFALSELGFKRGGFFVEFGATDGIEASNSHLLERRFGWRGLLAEPGRVWHRKLEANRRVPIDKRCVWSASGERMPFHEADAAELSSIAGRAGHDMHSTRRRAGRTYEVETVSLNDLLEQHGTPRRIDYLSIDTEGTEFDILEAFEFGRHDIGVITCEHNYTENREKVFALLSRHGYVRKSEGLSRFDDWYVKRPY